MHTNIIPQNSLTISGVTYPVFPGRILPHWRSAARGKGFDLTARIIDRLHLAARCHRCGGLNKVRLFTLMSSQPLCAICLVSEWQEDARRGGLKFLRRDTGNRHYAHYRAPCGHLVRRQFALVKRIAAGETGIRCETCQSEREVAEADAQGWDLIGPDAEGDPNYRLYRHRECGDEQRVARINMRSGRFSCGSCGKDWATAPSYLYAMAFTLENGREVVKLGFSRDPVSRLHFQLKRDPEMPCALLAKVPMATGQQALKVEKKLHAKLGRMHPDLVVDPALYHRQIRVRSEIYDAQMTPTILAELDRIDTASE